jgi:hypothetical protein
MVDQPDQVRARRLRAKRAGLDRRDALTKGPAPGRLLLSAHLQIHQGVTESEGRLLICQLFDTSKPAKESFMRKFAFVLAAIPAAVLSVSEIPSAQAYVPHHHHHLSYHRHHHHPYVARNGSHNGGNWSSDRYNGHGINDLGVTTNQGRKNNGG